jgi:hypothetical protein
MKVEVRGDGIAAFCCAHLLQQAGVDTALARSDRPRVPALLLSLPALQLIRDVFDRADLLSEREPIRKRVVQWDAKHPLLAMDHLGFVTSEEELLNGLLPDVATRSEGQPDWIVHCANPLPEGIQHQRFGSRKAVAQKVALRNENACVMESLAAGWLFLLPVDPNNGWLLSVGEGGLSESRVVAPRVVETVEVSRGAFPAHPRIADRLTGTNWIACGSAAMAFDPICGDGTALAVRAAILAAAVIRAMARGEDRDGLLQHYESRVRAGFGRHVDLCRQYYRNGFGGPWWDQELAALDAWPVVAEANFQYRLMGFDLVRL